MIKLNVLILSACLCLVGCLGSPDVGQKAVAKIEALNRSAVSGVINFEQLPDEVKLSGLLRGLDPFQVVYLSIYNYGDLSKASGRFLGQQFNGSAGNIELKSDNKGNLLFDVVSSDFNVVGDAAILGRSIVIHADQSAHSKPDFVSFLGAGVIGYKYQEPKK